MQDRCGTSSENFEDRLTWVSILGLQGHFLLRAAWTCHFPEGSSPNMVIISQRVVLRIKDIFRWYFSDVSKHQKTWGLKHGMLDPIPTDFDSLGLRWSGNMQFKFLTSSHVMLIQLVLVLL